MSSSEEDGEEQEEEMEEEEMRENEATQDESNEAKKKFSLDRYLHKVLLHKKEKSSALLALEDLECGLCGDVFDKPVMFKVGCTLPPQGPA